MKTYQPKQLNAFQRQRAPRAVSDAAFAELREELADENLFFKDSTYFKETVDLATGTKTKIRFDKSRKRWVAEFSTVDGRLIENIEADSRDELILDVAARRAQTTVENLEAEREVNPIFDSPWGKTVHEWMTRYKWGKRFGEWSEYLEQSALDEVCDMIRAEAYRLCKNAKLKADALEWAYVELLDSGKLDAYENAARTNRKWQDEKAAAAAAQDRITSERVAAEGHGYDRAMAEHEALEAAERVAEERKLAKTKKGMVELRRRALFGDKTNAFPISTGTAKRI